MSEKSDWEKGYDQAMMRTYGERKALKARIAELEAELTKGHELQDSYCDRIAELKLLIDDLTNIRNINDIDEKWWGFVDSAREELMR